jgi:hypothetical protein
MTKHRSTFSVCGVRLITAGLCLLVSIPARGDMLNDKLAKMWQQYNAVHSLHFKAVFSIEYDQVHSKMAGSGSYEFWADGKNYLARQLVDNPLALPGMRHDIRWNGTEFQHFDMNGSSLFISKNPRQIAPYIATNPLLFPFVYTFPAEPGRLVLWSDICSAATLEQIRKLAVVDVPGGGSGFKGLDDFKSPCFYTFEFGPTPDFMPTRIRAISPGGNLLLDEETSYAQVHCDNGLIYLPQSSKQTAYNPGTKAPLATADFEIKVIEADIPIPAETFTMDFQKARNVVDLDRRPVAPGGDSLAAPMAQQPTATAIHDETETGALAAARSRPVTAANWAIGGSVAVASAAGLIYLVMRRMGRSI